jgi:hypothetical protein
MSPSSFTLELVVSFDGPAALLARLGERMQTDPKQKHDIDRLIRKVKL